MKSFKILFSILLLTFIATSCSSDGPLANVKYQIVGLDSSILQIKYNGSTEVVTVLNPNNFANGSDSKKIPIDILPFQTKLEVTVNNTTTITKHYSLAIYVDNILKTTYNLDVPANTTSTGTAEYTIYAE